MFYTTPIEPQVYDSDFQGHTNFLSVSLWFDRARTALYREFEPNLNFREHGLVILKTEVTYVKEIWLARPVEVRTWTSVVGTKSFEITQEAWQDGEVCAVGKTIFCGFDFTVHKSEPISPEFRAVLEKFRFDPTAQEADAQ